MPFSVPRRNDAGMGVVEDQIVLDLYRSARTKILSEGVEFLAIDELSVRPLSLRDIEAGIDKYEGRVLSTGMRRAPSVVRFGRPA